MREIVKKCLAPSLGQYYQEYYLPYRGGSAWGRYNRLVEKDQLKIDRQRANLVKSYITDGVVLDIGCGKPTFLIPRLVRKLMPLRCGIT